MTILWDADPTAVERYRLDRKTWNSLRNWIHY